LKGQPLFSSYYSFREQGPPTPITNTFVTYIYIYIKLLKYMCLYLYNILTITQTLAPALSRTHADTLRVKLLSPSACIFTKCASCSFCCVNLCVYLHSHTHSRTQLPRKLPSVTHSLNSHNTFCFNKNLRTCSRSGFLSIFLLHWYVTSRGSD
jgi:hypothetical protein